MTSRIALSLMVLTLIAAPALAQNQPGQPGQPQRVAEPPPPPALDRGRPFEPRFEVRDMPPQLNVVRGYLGIIEQLNDMAQDPTASGIAAVLGANEILKPRGADAVIEYFTKLLPEVKSEPVQRAIRIQLIEAYKQSGQNDKALEELRSLITGAPVSAPAAR